MMWYVLWIKLNPPWPCARSFIWSTLGRSDRILYIHTHTHCKAFCSGLLLSSHDVQPKHPTQSKYNHLFKRVGAGTRSKGHAVLWSYWKALKCLAAGYIFRPACLLPDDSLSCGERKDSRVRKRMFFLFVCFFYSLPQVQSASQQRLRYKKKAFWGKEKKKDKESEELKARL